MEKRNIKTLEEKIEQVDNLIAVYQSSIRVWPRLKESKFISAVDELKFHRARFEECLSVYKEKNENSAYRVPQDSMHLALRELNTAIESTRNLFKREAS